MQIIPNGDSSPILFSMVQSSDHITPLIGASPTVVISKNGGSFGAPAGTVNEVGNGFYGLTPSGADTTTNGMLALYATATGGDPLSSLLQVQEVNVYTQPGSAGGLLVAGINAAVTFDSLTLNRGLVALGDADFHPDAVHLDGTTNITNYSYTTPASSLVSFSIWFNLSQDAVDNATSLIISTGDFYYINLAFYSLGTLSIYLSDISNTNTFTVSTGGAPILAGEWYNIIGSFDTNHGAGAKLFNIYLNDVSVGTVVTDADPAFTMRFDNGGFLVPDLLPTHAGDFAEYWVATGQYIDFSDVLNRRKFIDTDGKPVFLGAAGELPTGTSPTIFFSGDRFEFPRNRGTGGSFSVNGDELTDARTTPSGAGSQDGIRAIAGTGGDDINGNLVGDLAGSWGSLKALRS